jgi:hypothetical protein
VATRVMRTSPLNRCLQLSALALAFSLSHVMADFVLVAVQSAPGSWAPVAIVGVAAAVYGWWGWSMGQAAVGSRSGLFSLLLLAGIWTAVLNGATVVYTPITNVLADVIHSGCLLFGVWGAYAAWRLLGPGKAAPVRAADAQT